jgi:glutamine amidotransferase
VAWYEDRAARIVKDTAPAWASRHLALLTQLGIRSQSVIAHIRKANPTRFGRSTANTHPFERELNGRSWVFAHNGKLPGLGDEAVCSDARFRPLGETDSEKAFCLMLEAIARALGGNDALPPQRLVDVIRPVVETLSAYGEFNFILGNGDYLVAHAHTRLHSLQKSGDRGGCSANRIVLATAPLTRGPWLPLPPGSLNVYRMGKRIVSALLDVTPVTHYSDHSVDAALQVA